MKAAFLPDRGVVKVIGDDARNFLNNLVTTEIEHVKPGVAKFGALLTPQGKIVVDFLITEAPAGHGGGFLLDCARVLAAALATKLNFYKLRAKVAVDNLSDNLGVLAVWGGTPSLIPDLAFPDPRNAELGWRILVPADLAAKLAASLGAQSTTPEAYDAHRIARGVPRGGADFAYGDAFPHETNMDRLHGIDFDKGCYIGQEVISRMEHRGTARTRTVRVAVDGFGPEPGADVVAGDRAVGKMGSSADGNGLAILRIDKVGDALKANRTLSAGGVPVALVDEDEIKLAAKLPGV
jgi:folate-binding protein YgfZ